MGRWTGFRYEPLAEEYDVGICASSTDCKGGYSKEKHLDGYADPYGTVHWTRWHAERPRKRGLHKLLTLIAVIKMKHHRRAHLPIWKQMHERELWAQRQARQRFRLYFPHTYSASAKRTAMASIKRTHTPLRTIDIPAYQWLRYGKDDPR